MEKKFQVFVSSTYEDLQAERQEVMQVLLELDCIPSGMELFPASDADMWSLIEGVIDDCDYYMVIIAGRYGSIGSDGVSFTEKEYRYAVDTRKPVIAFLHGEPKAIPQGFSEDSAEGKQKLEAFRELARRKACKHWTNAHELGSVVARSLTQLKKASPGIGWVRGDQVPAHSDAMEILRLRKKIEELEATLAKVHTSAPPGIENLAQGEDEFDVKFIITFETLSYEKVRIQCKYSFTWNDIFKKISPLMIQEAKESILVSSLASMLPVDAIASVQKRSKLGALTSKFIDIESDCLQTIIVQLRALGLMTESIRNRSVKNTATYWTLTPYGETIMNTLRAIRRIHTLDTAPIDQ